MSRSEFLNFFLCQFAPHSGRKITKLNRAETYSFQANDLAADSSDHFPDLPVPAFMNGNQQFGGKCVMADQPDFGGRSHPAVYHYTFAQDTDFFFERKATYADTAQSVLALVTRRLPAYLGYPAKKAAALSVRNIQVLAPARKGECGVNSLNILLQEALNPSSPSKPQLTWGETVFRLGDKVIQTKNDYRIEWTRKTAAGTEVGAGIFNGDVGFITGVDPDNSCLTVLFDEEKEVVYERSVVDFDLSCEPVLRYRKCGRVVCFARWHRCRWQGR